MMDDGSVPPVICTDMHLNFLVKVIHVDVIEYA